jgi:hypothetical protein
MCHASNLSLPTILPSTPSGPYLALTAPSGESPAYIGGRLGRGAPCYGEDNDYEYGELLGRSPQEIKALADEGVICTCDVQK